MVNLVDCNREISELMYVLKDEIKMLRHGNFQNITQLSPIKAERTKVLAATMASLYESVDRDSYRDHLAPRLAKLKSLAIENGLLLRGVLNGVRSARERIQALKTQTTKVGVYGRNGKALAFEEQPVSTERTF